MYFIRTEKKASAAVMKKDYLKGIIAQNLAQRSRVTQETQMMNFYQRVKNGIFNKRINREDNADAT